MPFEPLAGVQVVQFAQYVPGPYCCLLLAQLGATVMKVEPPGGDPLVATQPGVYDLLNHLTSSTRLDLKTAAGKESAVELLARSDVVVESMRPGKMEALGLGYSAVAGKNPAVIYCSISGFGQTGPLRDKVGHDLTYLAWAGVLSHPCDEWGLRKRPSVPLADGSVAMSAALSIVAAYAQRLKTGEGSYIDVPIAESAAQFAVLRANWLNDGSRLVSAGKYPHLVSSSEIYETADGSLVAISLHEDHFWRHFVERVGQGHGLEDQRFGTLEGRLSASAELRPFLERVFRSQPTSHWQELAADPDLPLELVQSVDEMLASPHAVSRRMFSKHGTSHVMNFPATINGLRVGADA
ncbi:MAG: CoA transferase [Dehalococcoidia bacterium]